MTNHTDLAARFEAKREECKERESQARTFNRSQRAFAWRYRAEAFAQARDMARAGAAGGAGEGFVLVPACPTPEMLGAFWRTKNTGTVEIGGEHQDSSDVAAYRAMVAAAPPPPAQQGSSPPLSQGETVAAGPSPAAVEMMAEHLHEEHEYDRRWRWPEHADDDGYRGNGGYVTITPTDVQCRLREMARRVLICADQTTRRSGHLVLASLATARDGGTGAGSAAGWKMVPEKFTREMCDAWRDGYRGFDFSKAYRQMLAAAPLPPKAALATISATDQDGEAR